MLRLTIPETEVFDEEASSFSILPPVTLTLEHSLISLSKWESKFEKPFLNSSDKSEAEIIGYIEAMVLEGEVPENLLSRLSAADISAINAYIDSKQTATTFGQMPKKGGVNETITQS
jgi:hypothetical protein